MEIKLLHTQDCHAWQEAEKVLEETLIEACLPVEYKVVLVQTDEQAANLKFAGSPQITVNGIDVDPRSKNITNFSVQSCRPYLYNGRFYDFPPKEMITEAINNAQGQATV